MHLRDGRYRRQQEQFVIDGNREIERAIAAGIEIETLFCRDPDDGDQLVLPLQDALPPQKIVQLEKSLHARLAYGERHEGLIALAKTPARSLDMIQLPNAPLVLLLDRLEKPGNIGAILRSADAAGVDAILLVDCLTDLFNPNVIRASSGTVFSRRIAVTNYEQANVWIRNKQLKIVATRVEATVPYWQNDYCQPTALLVGNEASGLQERWADHDVQAVHIPMQGIADSLNASVTLAICLFEAVRQRCLSR